MTISMLPLKTFPGGKRAAIGIYGLCLWSRHEVGQWCFALEGITAATPDAVATRRLGEVTS